MLRLREPDLPRPFRVPGGMVGACLIGLGPAGLIAYAMYAACDEQVAGMPALLFALLVAVAGSVCFLIAGGAKRR